MFCLSSRVRPCWKTWTKTRSSVLLKPSPVSSQMISPGSCCVMICQVLLASLISWHLGAQRKAHLVSIFGRSPELL